MLNKDLHILSEQGIRGAPDFADFLAQPAVRAADFSPGILRLPWRRLIDHFVFYQTQNSRAREQAGQVQLDWVEPQHADQLAWAFGAEVAGRKPEPSPAISFVIPFRNREESLHLTLQALLRLKTDLAFEVIVVDDGSKGDSSPSVLNLLEKFPQGWGYLRLPACSFFRAGFARNLGARKARGEYLIFLDSDIVVSPNYLNQVFSELQSYDLVQGMRWQIWEDEWRDVRQTDKLRLDTRLRDEPNPFWRDFQLSKEDWMTFPQPWRFVSSNCLALKRSTFLELGGFRHWYTDYGFEDTDLGYRAWLSGLKFGRSANMIYHLTSSSREDWVVYLINNRNDQLRPSARKFFLINRPVEALDWLVHLIL